jgi:hypothetical protein
VGDVIAAYLRELDAEVGPLPLRRRLLAEAEDHLRATAEALEAEGVDRAEAERRAVERFGAAEAVARRLRAEVGARARRWGAWVVPLLVALYVAPFYVVPENAFPPAPWATTPGYLVWKHDVALWAFAAAVALALLGAAAAAWTARLVVPVLAGAAVAALALSAVVSGVMDAQWIDEVPGTSAALVYGAMLPLKALFVLAAATAVALPLRLPARA